MAVGVDAQGEKRVLGIRERATENATMVNGLLDNPVARGLRPDRRQLFVVDGSKALKAAIDRVFGRETWSMASSVTSTPCLPRN